MVATSGRVIVVKSCGNVLVSSGPMRDSQNPTQSSFSYSIKAMDGKRFRLRSPDRR